MSLVVENEKRLATLRARAALLGIALHKIEGDRGEPLYIITRWAMTRQLDTLDDLEAWLDRVSGKSPKGETQ